ncbi:hypothetical protein EV421DRAFT_1814703 [Armillaria borealis]|uniref:F-box domain-containing protein n=1 Tax=Armillaria borealis TaxID=47425 RepID=A0AA39JDF0_9AGAR|nr:hypothetical protein EV421DRAFT_1814703 [Armillaria borealis]
MADLKVSPTFICQRCKNILSIEYPSISDSMMEEVREGVQVSELHAESIGRAIHDLEAKLSECDSEISALETTLLLLRNARNDLKHSLLAHRSLVSPIRRLPIEILQAIFRDACDIDIFPYDRTYGDLATTSGTPLRLSSVCSHWRSVCLSTSELWTFHFVNLYLHHLPESLRQRLSCYSNRSNSRLFTISSSTMSNIVDQRYHGVRESFLQPHALHKLFDPYNTPLDLTRCHRIILDANNYFIPLILPPSLPALESVYISEYLEVTIDGPEVSRMLQSAPSLRELHLASMDVEMLDLPFHQIRTLWLQSCFHRRRQMTTSFLNQFTNLQHLTFFDDGIEVDSSMVSVPINIQSLHLFWAYNIPGIFTRLSFPCLTILELAADYGRQLPQRFAYQVQNTESQNILGDVDVTSMIPSLSGLRQLVLRNVAILFADVVRILEATEELASLSIVEHREPQFVTITEQFLGQLSDAEGFLSGLEHIELVWAAENPVDEGAIMNVMGSRVGVLNSAVVGVRGGGELGKATLKRMQSLRRQGLKISLF